MTAQRAGIVLDLDGTLVDSVFEPVVPWGAALGSPGHEVPSWRIRMLGVRTGGFSGEALCRAGAVDVVADPRELIGRL